MYKFNLRKHIAVFLSVLLVMFTTLPMAYAFITNVTPSVKNTFIPESAAPTVPPQDIAIAVSVEKTVLNIGSESIDKDGFEFVLERSDGNDTKSMVSDADGRASCNIIFTPEDIDKTYTYILYEMNDGREHVTYDDSIHSLSITISHDRSINALTAVKFLDGVKVEEIKTFFTNTYDYTKNGGNVIIDDETPLTPLPGFDDTYINDTSAGISSDSIGMFEIIDETPLGTLVNTADPTSFWRWALLMIISLGGVCVIKQKRKKAAKESIIYI